MTEPATILTVCTGNVCRSPYLERRLQHLLDASWGTDAVVVRSAGTGALVGAPVEPESAERLERAGGSAEDFAARQVTREVLEQAQLVIVASREHRTAVTRLYPKALNRTHALLDLAQLARQVSDDELDALPTDPREHLDATVRLLASKRGLQMQLPPEQADVHDPFRQGPEAFDLMQAQIEDALPAVVRVLDRRQ